MTLPKKFEVYLKTQRNISGKTLRNYRADVLHFSVWVKEHLASQGILVQDLDTAVPHLNTELFEVYKKQALDAGALQSTLNRRLSTLRNFGKFLSFAGILASNPTESIENVKQTLAWEKQAELILADFERNLSQEGISPITLKNYLSDVRQFLAWVPGQVTQAN